MVGANNLIVHGVGATLTIAAGAITVTDHEHKVSGAGALNTISVSGGNPSSGAKLVLIPDTGATWTVTASGGNIAGVAPSVVVGVPVYFEWDGTNWFGDSAVPVGSAATLTNKTINLASNTLTGTTAQFNVALSDNDFVTLAGTEALTNKTLTSPTLTTPSMTSPTITSGDATLTTGGLVLSGATKGIKSYGRATQEGEWTTFTPTVTPSAGTWTAPTYTTAKYALIGKTMFVELSMSGTLSVNASLSVTIPGGFTSASLASMACGRDIGGGGTAPVMVEVSAAGTALSLYKDLVGGLFVAGAANIRVTYFCEIQ